MYNVQSNARNSTARTDAAGGHPSLLTVHRDGYPNPVTLTLDPLTSRSMHAEILPYTMRIPSLVLIA